MDKPIEKTILEQVKRLEGKSGDPELEKRKNESAAPASKGQPAILLLFDATGSMGPLWRETEKTMEELIRRVTEHGSVKLKCCAYRDYCDAHLLFESSGWYSNPEPLLKFIRGIKCEWNMGGDWPEAVEYALRQAAEEPEVSSIILIADAPPREKDYEECYRLAADFRKKGRPIYAFRTPFRLFDVKDGAVRVKGDSIYWDPETAKAFKEIGKRSGGAYADINLDNPKEFLDMIAITMVHNLDPGATEIYIEEYQPSKKVREYSQSLPPAPKK